MPCLHTALGTVVTVSATRSTFHRQEDRADWPVARATAASSGLRLPYFTSSTASLVFSLVIRSHYSWSTVLQVGEDTRALPLLPQSTQTETELCFSWGQWWDGQNLGYLATDLCLWFSHRCNVMTC